MSSIFNKMAENHKKPQGRRGNGGGPRTMNLPVVVTEVHVANPKAPTPATDYVEAQLIGDAFNLKDGDTVRIKIKERPVAADDKTPMEIWHLQKGKRRGTGAPAGDNPTIVAEDAVMQADGTIECRWIKIAIHNRTETANDEWIQSEMISVGYLNPPKGDGKPWQHRDVHWVSAAEPIVSRDGVDSMSVFKETVLALLEDRPETASSRPRVIIRMINNNALGSDDFVITNMVERKWDKEAGAWQTPAQALDAFLADPENGDWLDFIAQGDEIAADNGTLEVWPAWRYPTSPNTLKKDIEKADTPAAAFLPAERYAAPRLSLTGEVERRDSGKALMDYGLLVEGTHMVARPQGWEDFIVNQSWTRESFPTRIHSLEDVITANLPKQTAEFFAKRGEKRVELKREARNEAKANAAPAASEEQGQGFDEQPDPTAGMGGFRPK